MLFKDYLEEEREKKKYMFYAGTKDTHMDDWYVRRMKEKYKIYSHKGIDPHSATIALIATKEGLGSALKQAKEKGDVSSDDPALYQPYVW